MKKENGMLVLEEIKLGNMKVMSDGRIWSEHIGCFRKPQLNRDKYLCVKIKKKKFPIHQIVWVAFNGLIPDGFEIDHIDNNKLNNDISNLQLLTPYDNYTKQALLVKGSKNPQAKINEDKVRELRKDRERGVKIKDLSIKFGISATQVGRIIHREDWSHVD